MKPSTRALLLWSLAVSFLKLWLVSQEEVIVMCWDSSVHAQMTVDRIWFHDGYQQLGYRPGLALIASAFQLFGMPYRLGIELLWLLACAVLARALSAVTGSLLTACIAQLLLALHPWSMRYFHYFMTEAPAGTLCLMTFALALLLGTRARLRWSDPLLWLAGLSLALWDLLRAETLLLVPTWLAWALLLLGRRPTWRARVVEGWPLLLPIAVLFAGQTVVKVCNRASSGLAVLSALEAPGYHALMSALFRVDAADASLHVPVTRASLAAAIAVSPTLQHYEAYLLDPDNTDARIGAEMCGRPGEFGPRVHTMVINSFTAGKWASLDWAKRDAIMQEAADEIEAALHDGRLPARWAWFPIDPNFHLWLPEVPSATWFNVSAVFASLPWWGESDDNPFQDDINARGRTADRAIFDLAAGRRAALRRLKSVVLEGEAVSTAGELSLVALEDEQGRILGSTSPLLAPALPLPQGDKDKVQVHTRFTIDCEIRATKEVRLSFWRDGRRICDTKPELGGRAIPASDGTETVLTQLWRYHKFDPNVDRYPLSRWKIPIADWFSVAIAVAAGVVLVAALRRGARPGVRGYGTIALMCALAIALRVGFYDLLTATFQVREIRYMQIASPLVVPLALATAGVLGGALRLRFAARAAPASDAP